jgi:hypothetical protein
MIVLVMCWLGSGAASKATLIHEAEEGVRADAPLILVALDDAYLDAVGDLQLA